MHHSRMLAILRVLRNAQGPIGGKHIAEQLELSGIELGERTIRNYLDHSDASGWTVNLGRRGRELTAAGLREVDEAMTVDRVGFVASKVDSLAYQMNFDPVQKKGKVILNISMVDVSDARAAFAEMARIYDAGFSMGRFVALGRAGERIGDVKVPRGKVAIGTICSVSINAIFLRANIQTTSRFGGLLQVENSQPKRFVEIINYDGSSLDPLEIFIRGHMTSVLQAAGAGSGRLGASFREVPMVALPEIRSCIELCNQIGLGGVMAVGHPGQPLLDVPVPQGRVGLIVCGGLNPIAAVVESGIVSSNAAMSTLCDFSQLIDYHKLASLKPRDLV